MKTVDIKVVEDPIEFMRKVYAKCLKDDNTFHFVIWANMKWAGRTFKGKTVLLRVDDERVPKLKDFLDKYYGVTYEVYDYPFPDRRKHHNWFGLGKKGIEAKYPDLFHKIYNLYSIMSLNIKDPKERQQALYQLLHIPLNTYHLSFIEEIQLYQEMALHKVNLLLGIEKKL